MQRRRIRLRVYAHKGGKKRERKKVEEGGKEE